MSAAKTFSTHRGNGPASSIAIVLGASSFPNSRQLDSEELAQAFACSKQGMFEYLLAQCGEVLDAFDCDLLPDALGLEVSHFLVERCDATDVVVYYVGHGGFFKTQDYYVALRCTDSRNKHLTTLRVADLARTIVEMTKGSRCYLVLDCCFAGGAVPFLTQGADDLLGAQARKLPHGIALLAASSKDEAAIVPEGKRFTMFSEALLDVLHEGSGDPKYQDRLSLRELGELVASQIEGRYPEEFVRPQVHSPIQRDGDPADHRLFKNSAHAKANSPPTLHELAAARENTEIVPIWRGVSSRRTLLGVGAAATLAAITAGAFKISRPPRLRVGVATEAAAAIVKLLEAYAAETRDVAIESIPYPSGKYESARVDFQHDDFDIVMIDDIWVPRYAAEGTLAPLERAYRGQIELTAGALERRFLGRLGTLGSGAAGLVALPFVANVLLAFYRDEGRVPEFPYADVDSARFPVPVGIRNDTNNNLVEVFIEALRFYRPSADPEALEGDDPLVLPREAAERALRWMWAHRPVGDATSTEIALANDFCEKRSSVIIGWPLWIGAGTCLGKPETLGQLGVAAVSTQPVLGAWYLAVRSTSEHRELAARLVVDLTARSEWQERLGNAGGFIPVLAQIQPTALRDHPFWRRSFNTVRNAFTIARPRTRSTRWDEIEDELGMMLQKSLGAKNADEAVALFSPGPSRRVRIIPPTRQ